MRHLAAQTHVWCCNPIELDWHDILEEAKKENTMLNVHNQDKLPFERFTRILFCFCSFVRIFAASLFWFYLQLPPSFYVQIPLIWLSLFAEHCRTWWSILTVSHCLLLCIYLYNILRWFRCVSSIFFISSFLIECRTMRIKQIEKNKHERKEFWYII